MTALAHLSIQRCRKGQAPSAPSREERARAFYAARPVPAANNYPWQFRQADEYARAESADGRQPELF